MAWSNITGVRLEGELIDFESTLRVGVPGGEIESTGREKQNRIRYNRDSATQTTITPMHGAVITQTVTDVDMSTVNLTWSVEAVETLDEGVYFCMTLTPKYYSDATIKTSGRNITIKAPERNISLRFNKSVKAFVREEDGNKVIYITLMPSLKKNAKAEWAAVMKVDGVRHHETAEISIDPLKPGREFAGFGGNFRIQNVQKDPMVIDYCLKNMRLAYGRVEMPWAQWDENGKDADHIKRSAEMARKLLPCDEKLRDVFRTLRKYEKAECSLPLLAAHTALSEESVLCALRIFEQLNLLSLNVNPLSYKLLPSGKVSLENSSLRQEMLRLSQTKN